jgi:iron complex transport system substrate-binding protein
MMKKSKSMIVLFLIAALWATACAPAAVLQKVQETEAATTAPAAEEEEQAALVFTDDLGNTLQLAQYPQAIVSLSPSMTEMLFALGAGQQLAGRDEMSTFPEAALEVASIGAMWGDLPVEAILAAEPDLVLAAEIISPETVSALQELGLTVYWQANPDTFEDLWDNLREIAALTGHMEEAETLVSDLAARVSAVQTAVAGAETTPVVFYELDATDPSNPWTTGSGTFIDYIITRAGGVNAAAALQGDYAQMSSEALITVDPDVILLGNALYGMNAESVTARAGWDAITAVKNAAIYAIDPNILSVPGPRLVDGLEAVAMLLHPELF